MWSASDSTCASSASVWCIITMVTISTEGGLCVAHAFQGIKNIKENKKKVSNKTRLLDIGTKPRPLAP